MSDPRDPLDTWETIALAASTIKSANDRMLWFGSETPEAIRDIERAVDQIMTALAAERAREET